MQQQYEAEEFLRREGLHNFVGATTEDLCQELYDRYFREAQVMERGILFRDAMDRLSESAREVVGLVLRPPPGLGHVWDNRRRPYLSGMPGRRPTFTRRNIRYYLRHCGWDHVVIVSVFEEIRDFLKKV